MYFFTSLAISVALHLFILFEFKKANEITIKPSQKISKIKVRTHKKTSLKKYIKPAQKLKKQISWQDLSPRHFLTPFKYKINNFSQGENSSYFKVYQQISQVISYPYELAQMNISGKVLAKIFINGKGKYIEKRSHFKSYSKFLITHVRRILRQSLKHPIMSKSNHEGFYKFYFIFHLSTGVKDYDKYSFNSDTPTFYTWRYGGDKTLNKIEKGIVETVSHVTNFLKLLDYLPKKRKKKEVEFKKIIQGYKNDPYWNK